MKPKKKKILKHTKKRLVLLNRYYKITQFYPFLKTIAFKAGVGIFVLVLIVLGIEFFLFDINELLRSFANTYPPRIILTFFLTSETFLGIIPPEIFIAWASKSSNPWFFLFLLATMSYIGGIISYYIGNRLFLIKSVKNYLENKVEKHIVNLRKWGGIFVVLGAVSPIPHSMVSLASGLIKYSFSQYALWALFRYLRFFIYGLIIFQVF